MGYPTCRPKTRLPTRPIPSDRLYPPAQVRRLAVPMQGAEAGGPGGYTLGRLGPVISALHACRDVRFQSGWQPQPLTAVVAMPIVTLCVMKLNVFFTPRHTPQGRMCTLMKRQGPSLSYLEQVRHGDHLPSCAVYPGV